MAERRMFAKTITNSDSFLEMPTSSQALYFHLSMNADDDGFINRPKAIMRMVGAKEDDLKILFAKSFIIPFDSGVVVIKHWKINNYIQKDRYKPTEYIEEKSTLTEKENGAYTLLEKACIQNVYTMDTQDRLGKDSIVKDSKEKGNNIIISQKETTTKRFVRPTLEEVKAYCEERNNGIDAERFIDYYDSKGWMLGKNHIKDWKACVRTWEHNRKPSEEKAEDNIPQMGACL